jgi:spore coat protein CotH
MYKKRDIIIIVVLFIVTSVAIIFWIYNREYFTVGESRASFDKESGTIFISLPEGSENIQKISFNFPYKNNSIYIKKISSGSELIENPVGEKLVNNSDFDFGDYISHSKLIIKSGSSDIEYDLWVTTGEVPIISIETEEDIADEPKVDCRLSILSADRSYMKKNIAAEIELIDISESILKDSYSLNIREDNITGDVPDILDLENTKRFKLSASYTDRSFLREKLSYEIFKSLSDNNIGPDGRFVELYENDSYKGLYILYERADRNMFSVSNYSKEEDTHSVIYETVNWRADFTRGAEGFSQIEPDMDNDGAYFGPLLELEDLIVNAEEGEFLENIEHMVNMDSVLDNHILFLLSGCTDELASNNYIYRGNDKTDKFGFSPGSHYLSSFGRDCSLVKLDPETVNYGTRLFNRLYQDEDYRERLKARWNDLRKEILTLENIFSLIDNNIYSHDDALGRDLSTWPVTPDVYEDGYSFDQEVDYIKSFIEDRLKWLDGYINYPPLIKIGGNYAKIDEKTETIFCSLPEGSDTAQKISWYFSPNSEIYLDRLPVSSSSLGRYLTQKSKYDDYDDCSELIDKSSETDDITIYIDRASENEFVDNSLEIIGWALNEQGDLAIGVEHILLFDGPDMISDNFLGEATMGLARVDVATYFDNPSFRDSGFEIYVNTLFLENGLHELYLYAFDNYGNYALRKIDIEINNDEDLFSELESKEKEFKQKLTNDKEYDFYEYIFHGRLTVKEGDEEKEYELYVTTSDIPIVNIYTGEESIPNNEKIDAFMQIISHDSGEKNFINGIVFDFYGKIGIELRGKTSLDFPKKQYCIEIRDKNDQDKNVSLLRMPPESDWILGAPYSDKTLMRNVLAFQISNEIGMYAPRTEFVEVFLHKSDESEIGVDYMGVYYLAEKIKRDNDRVDVERMDSDDDTLLTGGYILEMTPESKIEPGDSVIETERGLKLINIYPRGDSITLKQKMWITDYMNKFEQALFSDYFDDEESGYRKYIDVDSFIDYIIINELFKNAEAFRHSTFLYKERDGKLKAGPVWDFNLSSGNTVELVSIDNEPVDFIHASGNWKTRFFKDEYFVTKYKDRWKQLRKNVLSDENILSIIESNKESLSEAQVRNFNRWDILGKYIWPNPEPYSETYEEEIKKLENWLLTRAEWIDNSIDSL